jgi:hypothetical protein
LSLVRRAVATMYLHKSYLKSSAVITQYESGMVLEGSAALRSGFSYLIYTPKQFLSDLASKKGGVWPPVLEVISLNIAAFIVNMKWR